ncbi:MAG: protein translocase subunit SecD [Dehalococcoidales bacterium]|nr:protein translocase subunit SecD [Dehalococcoidales bacterium]
MNRKNRIPLIIIGILFTLAMLVVIPVDKGVLGQKGLRLGLDLQGGIHLVYEADLSQVEPGEESGIIDGVIDVLTNRINPLGVTEPVIQKLGENRVAVQLPGLNITDKEKERLSRTAILEFGELAADEEEAKWENELGKWKPAAAEIDGTEVVLSSAFFRENTYVAQDELGRIQLVFQWNKEGSQLSQIITTRLLNKRLGIFEGDDTLRSGEDGRPIAPVVSNVITDSGVITGLSIDEAMTLSKQLNAGRIPVPLIPVYEQKVSPILGADFVDMSLKAGIIGLILVMVFMMIYYRVPGALASGALLFYAASVLAIFKLIPVTLTLAGIGGFILSIGMAVDANVLIFERMKEELRLGRPLASAIEAGFSRAWPAIRDSNITTFIVCGILYWLGSSIIASAPVMGFATTLAIGVAVSMFSAVVVTRTFLRAFAGTRLAHKSSLFKVYSGKEHD